MNVIKEDRIND